MRGIEPRPNEDIVQALRTLLDQAKSGELQAIGWCAMKAGGVSELGLQASSGVNAAALLGESYMLSRAIAESIEDMVIG